MNELHRRDPQRPDRVGRRLPARVVAGPAGPRPGYTDRPTSGGAEWGNLAAILERIAARGGVASIPDPLAWEREQRQDRHLPGRESEE